MTTTEVNWNIMHVEKNKKLLIRWNIKCDKCLFDIPLTDMVKKYFKDKKAAILSKKIFFNIKLLHANFKCAYNQGLSTQG